MVWALSWCDKTSCHYKMPECFFPALFVYLCLSLSLALSEHQYNLMQSILFTLKSNKSASACVLMNFAVAVSSLLLLFFLYVCYLCVRILAARICIVVDVHSTTNQRMRIAHTHTNNTNQWHICFCLEIHSSPCRSIRYTMIYFWQLGIIKYCPLALARSFTLSNHFVRLHPSNDSEYTSLNEHYYYSIK